MRQRILLAKQLSATSENLRQEFEKVKISSDAQVKTNAVLVSITEIFEYTISFNPFIAVTSLKVTFLRRFFAKVNQLYTFHNGSVFTLEKIDESECQHTLFNNKLCTNVTLTLEFVQVRKGNVELLSKILDTACETFTPIFDKYVSKFVYSLCPFQDNRLLLLIDCEYYKTEACSIRNLISRYKKLFGENRYKDTLHFFLSKCHVYRTIDGLIYEYQRINWEDESVALNNKTQTVNAKLEQCHMAERLAFNHYESQSTLQELIETFFNRLKTSFSFINVITSVLPIQTVTFGDGVVCQKTDWINDLRNNEVFASVELWCWVIIHEVHDEDLAKRYAATVLELQDDVGMCIGRPLYFAIKGNRKNDYIDGLRTIASKDIQLVVVILNESNNKPAPLIKHISCIKHPVPTKIVYSAEIKCKQNVHDSLYTINSMLGGSSWSVNLPEKVLICAVDVYVGFDKKTAPVCSLVTNLACDGIQWYSKTSFLKEYSIRESINDASHKYFDINGQHPNQIVIYHTTSSSLSSDVIECYQKLESFLKMTVVLIDKAKLCCFDKNLSVGSVIRDKITEPNDFFLFSGAFGQVPRPTHYKIIKDTAGISPAFLEELTYKLCYLYYNRANVVHMPAPCIYARRLSKLVTETIYDIPSQDLNDFLYYL
ncbi:hypothetical protein RN001_014650 [Aquatica leii]|uniref:Piwi domain-containing protein n=1 Tax=Aquatica leii TaxID=1421715 RepID=A0AAN7NZW1_9COLE|nr:hypothetical protein RN001_014650 [Aquatica leii]